MCGILGIVGPAQSPVELSDREIFSMRDTMTVRGPDSAGMFRRGHVAFAHRRLAIRDLVDGNQPWVATDAQTVLVYNGELYNDLQLRRILAECGHQFRTTCDTEVVLAAYREWGPSCVERFQGMFALGVYDFRDDTLFLARDRFGIKPLYFAKVGQSLVFASSIAAILSHPRATRQPDFAVLSHYLTTFRITLGRATVFEGLQQLLPGEMLIARNGRTSIRRYWDYPVEQDESLGYDESAEMLEKSLREAVVGRLASDVPVGMFLSGGVDSSTIAGLVKEHSAGRMTAICGGGMDGLGDDLAFASQAARHFGFDYDEVRVDQGDYQQTWNWMLDQLQTPVSTPSDVIIYRIAKRLKESVGVALGGEGADELLCGYAIQHWSGRDFDLSRKLAEGRWSENPAAAKALRDGLCRQYGRDSFLSEVDHYFALNSLIPANAKGMLLQPWVWARANEDGPMWDYYGSLYSRLGEISTVRKHKQILHHVNLEALLARLDTATMLASLEARVPYTDHLLVEQMFRVPTRHKIATSGTDVAFPRTSSELESQGRLMSKRVLRTVAKQMMPETLGERRKASFPTPVQRWFAGPWADWARGYLRGSQFANHIFQPQVLCELTDDPRASGMWLWPLMNVALWGDRQFA